MEQAFDALSHALRHDTGNRLNRLKQIGGQWDAQQWQLFNEAFCVLAGPQAMRSSFHSSAGMATNHSNAGDDDLAALSGLSDRGFLNGSVGALFGL